MRYFQFDTRFYRITKLKIKFYIGFKYGTFCRHCFSCTNAHAELYGDLVIDFQFSTYALLHGQVIKYVSNVSYRKSTLENRLLVTFTCHAFVQYK